MDSFRIEKQWVYRGIPCVVIIAPMGHRCGYIGVPKRHPAGMEDHSNNIQVHGGVTWSEDTDRRGYPIDIPNTWWYGFDCAHSMDRPDPMLITDEYSTLRHIFNRSGTIKTLEFCVGECMSMVDQIIEQFGEITPPYKVELEDTLFDINS